MTGIYILILIVLFLVLVCLAGGLLLAYSYIKQDNNDLVVRLNAEFEKNRNLAWRVTDLEQAKVQRYIAEYAHWLPLYISDPLRYKERYNYAMQDLLITLVALYQRDQAKQKTAG